MSFTNKTIRVGTHNGETVYALRDIVKALQIPSRTLRRVLTEYPEDFTYARLPTTGGPQFMRVATSEALHRLAKEADQQRALNAEHEMTDLFLAV